MSTRWKIDDASKPSRVLCEHTEYPRLKGELVPYDDAPDEGDFLAAPDGLVVYNICWLEDEGDGLFYEVNDMYDSLAAALAEHEAKKAAV